MKKLYRVHLDRVLYVVADSEDDAEELALIEGPNPDECEAKATLATKESVEADHWENCPPYHGNDRLAHNLVKELNS